MLHKITLNTANPFFALYGVIVYVIYARLRNSYDLETVRARFQLQELVIRYATNHDRSTSFTASKLFHQNYGAGRSSSIVKPFVTYYPSYFVTKRPQHISYCSIPKNMSTVITGILCWLFSEEFRNNKNNLTITNDHERFCYKKNGLHAFDQIKKLAHGEKWVNFVMVREPQERFLSGFMFMCTPNNTVNSTCEGCIDDIQCALRTVIEQARRFAAGDLTARSYLLWHLGPQNWKSRKLRECRASCMKTNGTAISDCELFFPMRCHFQKNMDSIRIFKYSPHDKTRTLTDLTTVLKEGGVEESDIHFIISHISQHSTRHATYRNKRTDFFRQQLKKPHMQKMLVQLLYWDYVLFDYPLPDLYEAHSLSSSNKLLLNNEE